MSSSTHDESKDADEQPLVRHRTRRVSSSSIETASGPTPQHNVNNPLDNENKFPSEVFLCFSLISYIQKFCLYTPTHFI